MQFKGLFKALPHLGKCFPTVRICFWCYCDGNSCRELSWQGSWLRGTGNPSYALLPLPQRGQSSPSSCSGFWATVVFCVSYVTTELERGSWGTVSERGMGVISMLSCDCWLAVHQHRGVQLDRKEARKEMNKGHWGRSKWDPEGGEKKVKGMGSSKGNGFLKKSRCKEEV